MELPSKLLEQIAYNTRSKIEEHKMKIYNHMPNIMGIVIEILYFHMNMNGNVFHVVIT